MDVIITEWALQAYTDLVGAGVFSRHDYWTVLRPDVEKLKQFPSHPDFNNSNFWGPATDKSGRAISGGFKMKWHNLGPGRVQLRLAVTFLSGDALLCQAYVKDSAAKDKREAAKLKAHINQIAQGNYTVRGKI